MGIKGLHRHISLRIPHAEQPIDLIEEIENYKSKHGKSPTLLIDIKEFSHVVVQRDETGMVHGGRHPIYISVFRKFLSGLKNAGAILIFFAVGNKLNEEPHIFIPKREEEYRKHVKLLKRIDEYVPIRKILDMKNRVVPDIRATLSVEHNALKLGKQYGEVYINYVRHNQEIAQYANTHKEDVLAIIAGDTDFLVFEGEFEYWPAIKLNLKELMGVRVCRQTVWDELDVTPQQLAMVGALAGSIYLPHYTDELKAFYERIEHAGPEFSKIPDLAAYVRKIQQTTKDDKQSVQFDVETVARDVFGDDYAEEELNTIKNGLTIYNLKFSIPRTNDLLLRQLKRHDRLLYKLLTDKVFNVRDITYIDFENVRNRTYAELVCPLLQRMLGILFSEKYGTEFTRAICMKFSHEDPYEAVEETPCYPPDDLRMPFRSLYDNRSNEPPHKWRLFLWTIGIDDSLWETFRNTHKDLITPVATLMYLVEQTELSIVEADAILMAEFDARKHRMPREVIRYDRCLNGRFVRVAHLYTKIYELICGCFRVCGLPVYSDFIKFDGAHFHNYAKSFEEAPSSYSETIEPIKPDRLYYKPEWDEAVY